ncbi:MAG: hemolysin family protein [Thermomicrobiales bacterium]
MSTSSWAEISIIVVALFVLALASVVDAVLGMMSRQRLRHLSESRPGWRRTVPNIVEPSRALAGSFQILQAVAVAVIAALLTSLAFRELSVLQRVFGIVLAVAFYLLLGRALPRVLAVFRPEQSESALLRIGDALVVIAWPLRALSDVVAHGLAKVLPGPSGDAAPVATEDEFRSIALDGHDDGVIEAEEQRMIHGILHLEELDARDIMVPRVDVVAVEIEDPLARIVAKITAAGHSRIPVYHESIDRLEGVLYAKDLLPYVGSNGSFPAIKEMLRPIYVVPESKRVDDLLKELRREHVHMAIVVDEYGGVAGIVTIEDILEEIVGEIQDEYDTESPRFEVVGEDELIADGRLPIEDAEEALRYRIERGEQDDFGTLGGFVQARLGRLPRAGDEFDVNGIHVEILDVERHRIRRLRIVRRRFDGSQAEDDQSVERQEVGGAADT